MKIQWLGHSCFRLEESTGTVVVTDPYDSGMRNSLSHISAHAITLSHTPHIQNDVIKLEGNPSIINEIGAFEVEGVHISSLNSFCNSYEGDERGKNLIFKFRIDGVDICHLGDIGEDCNSHLAESIGSVDVLLLPIGGDHTINAEQAKKYVEFLMPNIVIPMRYKTRDCNLDIDKIDNFLKLFDDENIIYKNSNTIEFDRSYFDEYESKIIVLHR
ncbi:MAG: MBL fold metallo-hydrolase [Clostridia bacterium]